MLIVIPCEPRVQANARAIATSIVENTDPEDLLTYDLLCITPHQNLTAANDFVEILKGRCNSFNIKCIDSPAASLYDLVNKMWAKCLQVLAVEAAPNGMDLPVLWYTERGNQMFKKDAISTLDGFYTKRKARVVFGKRFHIPARTITIDHVDPARDTAEGTFVFSSQISSAFPATVPLSVSLQPADHFRVFLSGVLIGDQSEEYTKWDDLFTTEAEPKVEAPVIETPALSQATNSPQGLPFAAFGASAPVGDGQSLDVDGGMTLAQKRALLAMSTTRSTIPPDTVTYAEPEVAGVSAEVGVTAALTGLNVQTSEGTTLADPGQIAAQNKRATKKAKASRTSPSVDCPADPPSKNCEGPREDVVVPENDPESEFV